MRGVGGRADLLLCGIQGHESGEKRSGAGAILNMRQGYILLYVLSESLKQFMCTLAVRCVNIMAIHK